MKINISKGDILMGAICAACAWVGGAVVGLINEKLEPAYGRGYAQGREDACKEILEKLTEGLEELKARAKEEEEEKENETEEEEDGS